MKALSMTLTIALTIFAVNSHAAARKTANVKSHRPQAQSVAQQNPTQTLIPKSADCPLKKMKAMLRSANTSFVASTASPNRSGSATSAVGIKN